MSWRSALVRALARVTRRVHPRGTFHLVLRLHRPDRRPWSVQEIVEVGDGMRVHADTSSFVEWLVFFLGRYEPEVAEVIKRALRSDSDVIDVGANVGLHTLTMASAARQGRVLACEPNPDVRKRLDANLALNGLTNVLVREVAVVDSARQVKLYLPDPRLDWGSNQGTASMQRNHPFLSGGREIAVEGVTLDQLVEQEGLRRVDLVKIDVEGFEAGVLLGGKELLRRDHPALVFEYRKEYWDDAGYSLDQVFELLRSSGYTSFRHITRRGQEPVPPTPDAYMNLVVTV